MVLDEEADEVRVWSRYCVEQSLNQFLAEEYDWANITIVARMDIRIVFHGEGMVLRAGGLFQLGYRRGYVRVVSTIKRQALLLFWLLNGDPNSLHDLLMIVIGRAARR